MGFAFCIEKTTNKTFVKFCQSTVKNHITTKRLTFLSTSIFITKSKTHACQQKTVSIDRFSSKTKIGKHSWYFNNSLLCRPNFCSAVKGFLSSLKIKMNTSSLASEWWEYITSCLKKNGRTSFENSATHKNIKISRLKKEVKNPEMKMKISRQKLNQ